MTERERDIHDEAAAMLIGIVESAAAMGSTDCEQDELAAILRAHYEAAGFEEEPYAPSRGDLRINRQEV